MVNIEKIIYYCLVLFSKLFFPAKAISQEYKFELGATTGTSFYMGDANKTKLYLNPGISGGVFFRYNINFNWAIKTNLLIGQVSGNKRIQAILYLLIRARDFSRIFKELGLRLNLTFCPMVISIHMSGQALFTLCFCRCRLNRC